MRLSNFAFELAEQKSEKERAQGILKAREVLKESGTLECIDCGKEINAARRRALPSAKRCILCQTRFEKG